MDNYYINTLKSSKKYSNSHFEYINEYTIYYTIGSNRYHISINYLFNKIIFSHQPNFFKIGKINIGFIRDKADKKRILSKFGLLVKNINKINNLILKTDEVTNKIKQLILSYFKINHNLEIDFDKIHFDINLSDTYRRRTGYGYDLGLIKDNPIFNIVTSVNIDKEFSVMFHFNYSAMNNRLKIDRKEENYVSKNISKIIRSEKLKKIELLNGNY